jgi:dTDP-4-amino-4,6-dideoxygalactose transaminase
MNADEAHDEQAQALHLLGVQYGRAHGVLTASGASALEAALRYLGATAGTEVIIPDAGCYKIGAAVLREGARPVFATVGPGLVLDVDTVGTAVTSRTRCVVAVHQYGLPCPVAGLRAELPDEVRIVEDAAQSWDARAEGRSVGRDGDVVVVSFGRSKPVPLGAGGCSATDQG